jgi:hypothetical protein
MPGWPTMSDAHVNRPLTDMAIRYLLNQKYLVADSVFPNIPVARRTDIYAKYKKEDWMRIDARVRNPGTESAGGGYELDTSNTYNCTTYALHRDIADEERNNADQIFQNLDRDATLYLTEQMLRKREKIFVDKFFKSGVWTDHDYAGATSGDGSTTQTYLDTATVDPVTTIKNIKMKILAATGYEPNVMVVGPYVNLALENHPKILDRIKYTQRGVVSEDILSQVFGVDKYLVPRVSANTAAKKATASIDLMYGKHVLLAYAAPNPSITMPSSGYTFSWQMYGSGTQGIRMKTMRAELKESDRIEAEMAVDMRLTAVDLGAFIDTAIST